MLIVAEDMSPTVVRRLSFIQNCLIPSQLHVCNYMYVHVHTVHVHTVHVHTVQVHVHTVHVLLLLYTRLQLSFAIFSQSPSFMLCFFSLTMSASILLEVSKHSDTRIERHAL